MEIFPLKLGSHICSCRHCST